MRNWLASLWVRLIVTYVLVTALSFGLLWLLLMKPVERFIMQREEDKLSGIALTLGSTIRDPWKFSPQAWLDDQFWTQRRSADLSPQIGARIRVLDPRGFVLTDSKNGSPKRDEREKWLFARTLQECLAARPEVAQALEGKYAAKMRSKEDLAGGPEMIYLALPILRRNPKNNQRQVAFIMYLSKPVESVRKNLLEMRRLIEVGMLTGLLITILVSIVLAGNLSAGLRNATQVAREFAAGRMARRMCAAGSDEVGQLGAAFNQMADALERHEQLRRDLLADVSHELRTPLTAIAGCADTLANGALREDPARAEHFLAIIVRESARLQRLVRDILELSRLQSGTVSIPLHPIPLTPLIDEAVEIARMNAAQQNLRVCWEPPGNEVYAPANEDRLAQALRNLLDNARHHTPGGGMITVSLAVDAETVCLAVRNEGAAIPPEDLPWVFDRFFRSGEGRGTHSGAGLGLAIVRQIIIAHAGQVTVESAAGVGTTFTLRFPRVQKAQDI